MIKRMIYHCLVKFFFFWQMFVFLFVNSLMYASDNENFHNKCRESFLQELVLWLGTKETEVRYKIFVLTLASVGIPRKVFEGTMHGIIKDIVEVETKIMFEGWSNDS